MAEEEEQQESKPKGGGGGAKIAILALILCNLLALGALGAFVLLGSGDDEPPEPVAEAEAADGEKPAEDKGDKEEEKAADEGGDDAESEEGEETEYSAADLGPMVKLGDFVVNLNNPGQSRYLKISLRAEVSDSRTRDELRAREPQMRDVVISYLSSLPIKQTYGARAKAGIRDNIRRRLNQLLTTGEVKRIFYTDFMTQ